MSRRVVNKRAYTGLKSLKTIRALLMSIQESSITEKVAVPSGENFSLLHQTKDLLRTCPLYFHRHRLRLRYLHRAGFATAAITVREARWGCPRRSQRSGGRRQPPLGKDGCHVPSRFASPHLPRQPHMPAPRRRCRSLSRPLT
ncbi:hypothetical protein FGO68_gene9336 [Halteria grandinella]|uniref:Uncharacterized protein n=1 Tax=Halteria grandinella TaxID=5974 RepID=A0A8J8NXG6_HALGN|nr:hypothetical protein FGO68_gene9336 [Halteria grandinella]